LSKSFKATTKDQLSSEVRKAFCLIPLQESTSFLTFLKEVVFRFASLLENEQAARCRPAWAAPLQRETFYANGTFPSTTFLLFFDSFSKKPQPLTSYSPQNPCRRRVSGKKICL
jgi:hypothetical protein